VQEALTNVLRHAHATAVSVTVRPAPDGATIEVVDDGIGASGSGGAGPRPAGHARAGVALGGTVECGPVPGGGWRVRAWLPTTQARTPV
jgi:signal transduction histidine kinase